MVVHPRMKERQPLLQEVFNRERDSKLIDQGRYLPLGIILLDRLNLGGERRGVAYNRNIELSRLRKLAVHTVPVEIGSLL
jgi:hypothetical protein